MGVLSDYWGRLQTWLASMGGLNAMADVGQTPTSAPGKQGYTVDVWAPCHDTRWLTQADAPLACDIYICMGVGKRVLWYNDRCTSLSRYNYYTICWKGAGRSQTQGKAGIPPGKSDTSGDIWPKNLMLKYRCVSARCRPMRPISSVEFQLKAWQHDLGKLFRCFIRRAAKNKFSGRIFF